MVFTLVDVICIGAVIIFAVSGFMLGLIQAIGALVGIVLGAWLAGQYFLIAGDWLQILFLGNEILANIAGFILIFVVVEKLVGFVFYLLNKFFGILFIIPFLKTINRFAGLLLGIVEGVLITGLSIYAISKLGNEVIWLKSVLDNSAVAHWLVNISKILVALLPDAITKITGIF